MAALLAGTLPIDRLAAMRLIVTPGTVLRWHRDIVRRRWARRSRHGRSGRPPPGRNARSVALRLARENESWGYRRIHGELAGLDITVAASTVWQILKSAGIDPAPRRDGPGWPEFLRSQAQGILAPDFFTADLLNGAKIYVMAAIEHGTRRVRVLGATGQPIQAWVVQQARKPAHGPGRCRDAGEVRAARQGRQLHAGVRCRVPGRGASGSSAPRSGPRE
jgi:transposase